jgi:hypothetical protein
MNRHQVIAPPKPQSREEAGKAEHVIEMGVCQQDSVKASETGAAA